MHDTTVLLFILISNWRYQALKQKPLTMLGGGQAAPCTSLHNSGLSLYSSNMRVLRKNPLTFPAGNHSWCFLTLLLIIFLFLAQLLKAHQSSYSKGAATPPLEGPVPSFVTAQPTHLSFSPPPASYRVLLQNILKHRLGVFHHQTGFLLGLTWACGETFPNPNVTINYTELPTPTILAMGQLG